MTTNLSQARWKKASLCHNGGSCVEVAGNLPGIVAVRDSKNPGNGAHVISRAAFGAFLADVKQGHFDI